MLSDVVAALATPSRWVRTRRRAVSGVGSFDVIRRVVPTFRAEPRLTQLATFVAADGTPIDRGICIAFPAPHSYTGDDTAELTCHGGLVAPVRLLEALHAAGARPAFPSEFSRRAVLNDRLALVQAEAVGDLLDATALARAASPSGDSNSRCAVPLS